MCPIAFCTGPSPPPPPQGILNGPLHRVHDQGGHIVIGILQRRIQTFSKGKRVRGDFFNIVAI